MAESGTFKIPQSVLVVLYTPRLDVLLIRRADRNDDYWQSVTGSKDHPDEPWDATARREVWEETGLDSRPGGPLAHALHDWGLENVYDIYPSMRWKYAPGTVLNTERVFGLCVPHALDVRLNPREHTHWRWLPWLHAADCASSFSNAEAILHLPRFADKLAGHPLTPE